jgi:hypothetical protein
MREVSLKKPDEKLDLEINTPINRTLNQEVGAH